MPGTEEKLKRLFSKEELKSFDSRLKDQFFLWFPIISWIPKYNLNWFTGDIIAGLTTGLMIVPQSLAYAKLASLPIEYGLYSSFVGPIIYAFLGTSKDSALGPSSVLSLATAQFISSINHENKFEAPEISICITFLAGLWLFIFGLLRLGLAFKFVPLPTIMGFSAGASFVVCAGQLPSIFGVYDVNNQGAVHTTVISMIEHITNFHYFDLIIGISSLMILFGLKLIPNLLKEKSIAKLIINYISLARNVILIIFMIILSFTLKSTIGIGYKLVGQLPVGFPIPKMPNIGYDLLTSCLVPSMIISLLIILEHTSSTNSISRINGYTINYNQEALSCGLCNAVSSLFGSFPITGAFSRTAVNSQSGVKTPLSGILTGSIVIVAILFLTKIFEFIPSASLSSIIFMSLYHNIKGPGTFKKLYSVNKIDSSIFLLTYLTTIFTSIQTGLISSIIYSIIILLYKIARPRWQILLQDMADQKNYFEYNPDELYNKNFMPSIPGIIVFRWQESIIYPNCDYFKLKLMNCVLALTKSPVPVPTDHKDRVWSEKSISDINKKIDRFPLKLPVSKDDEPYLRAIVFDFSSVNDIDYSGLTILKDLKSELEKYSGCFYDPLRFKFQFHYANCHPNVKSSLLSMHGLIDTSFSSNSSIKSDHDQLILDFEKELKPTDSFSAETRVCNQVFIHENVYSAVECAICYTFNR